MTGIIIIGLGIVIGAVILTALMANSGPDRIEDENRRR